MNSVLDDRSTETWVSPQQTYDAVVVGNVTMLLLLLGVDPTPLSMSPFTPAFMDQLNVEAREVGLHIHPHGYVQTLPALGAYVGADIVAGGPAHRRDGRGPVPRVVDAAGPSGIALPHARADRASD